MKKNINSFGRILRLFLALVIFLYAWWQNSWIAFAIGVFVIFEALMSWCIIYQILGKNSCPIDKRK
ncbi:MAG: DUF2892 domain-containing protein [Parachlamydiaceae bacterium]|nr:DUF2892 domain-containing protein [Parachlamydiaceae bacterium]